MITKAIGLIGIDPGKSGGIAHRDSFGVITLYPMPDTDGDIIDLLWTIGSSGEQRVFMEQVGGYVGGPGAPGSAMFSFGMNYGLLKGAIAALRIPIELVTPQKWQKPLSVSAKEKAERKRRLKEKAQQKYPQVSGITLKTCDALLILDYAISVLR